MSLIVNGGYVDIVIDVSTVPDEIDVDYVTTFKQNNLGVTVTQTGTAISLTISA